MENEILRDASAKIKEFDGMGLHYNLIAEQIYDKRRSTDPFDESFLPYLARPSAATKTYEGGLSV
jgi:hypothetical protein